MIAVDDPHSVEVRNAFGNAVTQWMSALQDLGNNLPAAARAAVAGMQSRSAGGYSPTCSPSAAGMSSAS